MPLRGYSWPGRPAIFLLAGLGPGRTAWVAAHETAHVADEPGKPDAEARADAFADHLLGHGVHSGLGSVVYHRRRSA